MKTAEEILQENLFTIPLASLSPDFSAEIIKAMKEYAKQFIDKFQDTVEGTWDTTEEGQPIFFTTAEVVAETLHEIIDTK